MTHDTSIVCSDFTRERALQLRHLTTLKKKAKELKTEKSMTEWGPNYGPKVVDSIEVQL